MEGLQKLRRFCAMATRRIPGEADVGWRSGSIRGTPVEEIAELLQLIQIQIERGAATSGRMSPPRKSSSNDYKYDGDGELQTWMLAAERCARIVGGGRITACRDGLDLSSMATTLEFAVLLRDNHRVPGMEDVSSTLRLRGVRRDNIQKNTYQRKYMALTRHHLPKLYRPPRGTCQ